MIPSLINIKHFQKVIELDVEDIDLTNQKAKDALSELVKNVIVYLQNTNEPADNKLLTQFIKKITIINDKLSEAGQKEMFSTSICALKHLRSQRKSGASNLDSDQNPFDLDQDPFVLRLRKLFKDDFKVDGKKIKNLEEDKKVAAFKALCNFQINKLIPALKSAKTIEEMNFLQEIVLNCFTLGKKLSSVDDDKVLNKNEEDIRALFRVKSIQTEKLYVSLIYYTKGDIGKLDSEEKREEKAKKLNVFISKFVKHSAHPVFSQEDKEAICTAMCTIHEEFQQYQDERLNLTLEKLHRSLGLSLPQEKLDIVITQRSSKFENLMAQWQQPSTSGSSSISSKVPRVKKNQSEEEIRDAAVQRILSRISNLDLQNDKKLNEDITAIKSDIRKLKNLSSCQKQDFTQLEKMLDLITNPKALRVSPEESRFIELLFMNQLQLTQVQLEKLIELEEQEKPLTPAQANKLKQLRQGVSFYSDLQKFSVENAQLEVVQTLKKNANNIGNLLQSAEQIGNGLQDRVVKNRFNRFVEKNSTFASLSNCFPALVNVFADFTNNVAGRELNIKWEGIVQIYDGQTKGKFSKLLKNYSYMDPSKQFDGYIESVQFDFFKALNLQTPFTNSNLNTRLQQVMAQFKDYTGNYFESTYMATYSKKHLWLTANCDRIVIPFNQGDDEDKNLGKGVCLANSMYRYKQLMDNPDLKTLQMGSNDRTRYVQLKYGAHHDLMLLGKTSNNAVRDEVAKDFGLKRYHDAELPPQKADVRHQDLVDEMEKYANAGHTQFVMSLYSPDAGHALNIQIHIQNGLFRMMDDNIGQVQYSSLKTFKKEVKDYFETFYPEYDTYFFRLFTV